MSNIMSRERLEFTGNLGNEPQLRYTPNSGTAVINLSIAVDRTIGRDENGKAILEAFWYTVPVFGKQAEDLSTRLWKGCPVEVRDAYPILRTYTRKDGTQNTVLEVKARTVVCLQPLDQVEQPMDSEGWSEAGA